jgi:YfiH family protein
VAVDPPAHPMAPSAPLEMRLGPARVQWTGRVHGHLGRCDAAQVVDAAHARQVTADIAARRSSIEPRPWSWLHQVHGSRVVVVAAPGAGVEQEGDALVTRNPDAVLAAFSADCAVVALAADPDIIGVAHAGWRGLAAGVLERAVDAMRGLGASRVIAALGPCIRGGCYEFAGPELETMVETLGPTVRATTSWGTPALDLVAAVEISLQRAGAELVVDLGACTACSDRWYSHRARRDAARQATVVTTGGRA